MNAPLLQHRQEPALAIRRIVLVPVLIACAALPRVSAQALYLVEEATGGDILLRYEAGTLAVVGGIGFEDVRGLAYHAGTGIMYGLSRDSNRLLTIDLGSGAGTIVANTDFLAAGSNMNEMSADATGALYANGHLADFTTADTLVSVNATTGVGTTINPGGYGTALSGLAFDHGSGTLYGTSVDGSLYTVDTTLGTASLVGEITGTAGTAARIAFDQTTGVLFGITTENQLVTIDLGTLAATEVEQFSVTGQIYALDFALVPEPSTTVLLLGCGALVFVLVRHRCARRSGPPAGGASG